MGVRQVSAGRDMNLTSFGWKSVRITYCDSFMASAISGMFHPCIGKWQASPATASGHSVSAYVRMLTSCVSTFGIHEAFGDTPGFDTGVNRARSLFKPIERWLRGVSSTLPGTKNQSLE